MHHFIFFQTLQDKTVEWVKKTPDETSSTEISLTDIHIPFTEKLTIVIPGNLVSIISTVAPKHRQWRRSIPYVIEDELAGSIEHLHIAINNPDEQQHILCAVIDKGIFHSFLENLQTYLLFPQQIVPDTLLMPYNPEANCLILTATRALWRKSKTEMLSLSKTEIPMLLSLFNSTDETYEKNLICYAHDFQSIENWPIQKSIIKKPLNTSIACWLAQAFSEDTLVNFLQGEFCYRSPERKSRQVWLITSILLFLSFFTLIFERSARYFYIHQQQKTVEAQISSLYYTLFPEASAIIAPKLRIEQALEKQAGFQSAHFFELSNTVSKILIANKITTLSLDYQTGRLNLSIRAHSFEQLGIAVQQLKTAMLSVQQKEAHTENHLILANLIITETSSNA